MLVKVDNTEQQKKMQETGVDLVKLKKLIIDLIDSNEISDLEIIKVTFSKSNATVVYQNFDMEDSVTSCFPDHFNLNQIAYLLFTSICQQEDISYNETAWNEDIAEIVSYFLG